MTREELLEPIVRSIRKHILTSRFEVLKSLEGCEAVALMLDGQHAGTIIYKGTEVHFAFVEGWAPRACRKELCQLLRPLRDRFGFLTTRLYVNAPLAQHRLAHRVGFRRTWSDGVHQYYMLGRLPGDKEQECTPSFDTTSSI